MRFFLIVVAELLKKHAADMLICWAFVSCNHLLSTALTVGAAAAVNPISTASSDVVASMHMFTTWLTTTIYIYLLIHYNYRYN